jgi:hypothetical protein
MGHKRARNVELDRYLMATIVRELGILGFTTNSAGKWSWTGQ